MTECFSLCFFLTMAISDSSCGMGDPYAYPLCVPQDRLEDIDMFPSFIDDLIIVSDFGDIPREKVTGETKKRVVLQDYDNCVANDDIVPEKVARETKRIALQDSDINRIALHDSDSSVANINRMVNLISVFPKKKPRANRTCGREWSSWLEWSNRKQSMTEKWAENIEECSNKKKQRWAESWAENIKKRRCRHCKTEKTPQWREGPSGPKTLCNACGVRYKSGRLVAEYRPVKSPTFDNQKHSNFHKQILKRKQACR